MLHKMLIFKGGIGFSSSRRRNQRQPDAKVEQGIPLSNPSPTLFHPPPPHVENYLRNRVGAGSALESMPTWHWFRRWNQFHGIDAKFLKSLKIRPQDWLPIEYCTPTLGDWYRRQSSDSRPRRYAAADRNRTDRSIQWSDLQNKVFQHTVSEIYFLVPRKILQQ